MQISHEIYEKLYELYLFCKIYKFETLSSDENLIMRADKGAVRILADALRDKFLIETSTGASESCALTDLKIGCGSLFINGKEFVI